jgi:hypothetical protein
VKQGLFDPEDWVNGGAVYSQKRAARGEAPLQADAYRLQDDLSRTKRETLYAAEEIKKDQAQGLAKTRERARVKRDDVKPKETPQVLKAARALEAAKNNSKNMYERMPQMEPSAWTQRFNAQVLATPFTLPFGGNSAGLLGKGAGKFIGGTGIAHLLASEKGQLFAAGQTSTQKKLAEWLRKYDANTKQNVHNAGYGVLRELSTEDY